jgi:hypothetical protein
MLTYNLTTVSKVFQPALELVRYFPRQLITADDMRAEQEYFREKLRRHNRYLHGWGVVCGCNVTAAPDDDHPWQVKIEAGYVISPNGDEICIPSDMKYDLSSNWYQRNDPCAGVTPCPPTNRTIANGDSSTVYLAVCYAECDSRPVRVHPAGCGCDDTACEYSRIRESYELTVLDELPESYSEAIEADKAWATWAASNPTPTRLPPCSVGHDDCVVLARITLPNSRNTILTDSDIAFDERRVVLSYPALDAVLEAGTATPGSTTPGTTPAGGNGSGSNPGTTSDTTGGTVHISEIDVPPLEEDNLIPAPPPVEVVAVELDAVPLELSMSEPVREGVFNAKITLNGPAPEGGTIIALTSESSRLIDVRLPSGITIPAGQSEKTFEVKVKPSAAARRKQGSINLTINANLGNQIKSAHLKGNVRK